MKVHKFKLSGQEMPFYFGIDCVEEVMKGMEDIGVSNVVSQMRRAFSSGLRHGHKKEGLDFKLTPPKVTALIDDNPKILLAVWKAYNNEAKDFFPDQDDEKK